MNVYLLNIVMLGGGGGGGGGGEREREIGYSNEIWGWKQN